MRGYQTAQASSPSINNQELPDLHRRIRNRTHRPRNLINEAAAHTLFYTPVDTTPSDSILSLVVRIKGQLCSRSHPKQTSSGPPKPFAAIPGSAALNNLPQVHWEHDCTDRHVHFARKRIDLGRPARQNTWLPHLPHLGEVHDHQRWISAVLEGGYTQPALPACSRLETRREEQHGRGEYVLHSDLT